MGFLSNSITVDVYTNQQYAYDQCKPQLAKKYIPEWWKSLPASRPTHQEFYDDLPISSMKQCPAINDILKAGIIFPSWCELHMRVGIGGEKEVAKAWKEIQKDIKQIDKEFYEIIKER
jgi:hypothetical protein